jgi:sigma-B regulation protein RsbU (phosphoserine phosphatase)
VSIRWKFLLILLGFSAAPLLVFVALNYRASISIDEDFGDISRRLIIYTANKELQDNVENYARNLSREMRLVEDVLRVYAGLVVKQVAGQSVATESQPPAPPVSQPALAQRMAALQELLAPLFDYLERQRISLAGGVAAEYPAASAEGGEIKFDIPRTTGSADGGKIQPVWVIPKAADHRTQTAILTVILPLRRPEGNFLGDVALDLNLSKLLEKIKPPSQWTSFMLSLLALTDTAGQTPGFPPPILAVRDLPQGISRWQTSGTRKYADLISRAQVVDFFADFQKWPKGYASYTFNEEPSIWAYAVAANGLTFIHILPHREAFYRLTQTEFRLRQWYSLDTVLVTACVLLLLAIFAYHRSKKMIGPILYMVRAFKRLSEGDFSTRLKITARDERKMVVDAFNTMAHQLEDRIRIRQALEVAREVQQNFLPKMDLRFPGFDIAARIQYCDETGGDYIDLLTLDDQKLGVVVSDVTGHGVGAALLMATARALVRGRYGENGNVTEMMNFVNRKLAADIGETGRFMTLFFLEIDRLSRSLQWIRAGHDPAWLATGTPPSLTLLDGPGIALGVDDQYAFKSQRVSPLNPGDLVVIGTDGIWETIGPDNTLFGKKRLEELIAQNAGRPVEEICDAVLKALNNFRGDIKQQDDVSLVAIKVLPEAV